jgi:putative effector of murein hydrolase LrgA (UPF0299 family)
MALTQDALTRNMLFILVPVVVMVATAAYFRSAANSMMLSLVHITLWRVLYPAQSRLPQGQKHTLTKRKRTDSAGHLALLVRRRAGV